MEISTHINGTLINDLPLVSTAIPLTAMEQIAALSSKYDKKTTINQEDRAVDSASPGPVKKAVKIDDFEESAMRETIAWEGELKAKVESIDKENELTKIGYDQSAAASFLANPTSETAKALMLSRVPAKTNNRSSQYKSLQLYADNNKSKNWVLFDPRVALPRLFTQGELRKIVKLAFWERPMTHYLEYNLKSGSIRVKSGALIRFRNKTISYTVNGPILVDDESSDSELTEMESE